MDHVLPIGWDNSAEALKKGRPIVDFVNWSYSSGNDMAGKAATFDFRVYPYFSSSNSIDSGYDGVWGGNFVFKVVDISGAGRGFNSNPQPKASVVFEDLLGLSRAVDVGLSGKVPKKGDNVFEGNSKIKVDSFSINQDNNASDTFLITFVSQKRKFQKYTLQKKPKAANVPTVRDPFPWEGKPKIQATIGSENFSVGTGYFCGKKTPKQIMDAIEANDDSMATMYVTSGATPYQLMTNSAGDPFKSPPQMKVGVTNFELTVSYSITENLTPIMTLINNARESVNSKAFSIGVLNASFAINPGTAMLTGATISPADFTDRRDWLPKQKHPFSKTNSELGWTGEGYPAGEIAVNIFERVLQATQNVPYLQFKLSVVVKEVGWGAVIPNKGFRSLKTGKLASIKEKDSSKTDERLLDGDTSFPMEVGVDTFEKNVLRLYTPFPSNESLEKLLFGLPWDRVGP